MADTTNKVENLHSVRRKWADKRLNFPVTYKCRANLALLSSFVDNWQALLLEKIGITPTDTMMAYFQVTFHFIYLTDFK
jgi:hypothetical protein